MALRICPRCRVRQVDETGKEECQFCRTPFVWQRWKIIGWFLFIPRIVRRSFRVCPGGVCGNVTLTHLGGDPLPDYCEPCEATITKAKDR